MSKIIKNPTQEDMEEGQHYWIRCKQGLDLKVECISDPDGNLTVHNNYFHLDLEDVELAQKIRSPEWEEKEEKEEEGTI